MATNSPGYPNQLIEIWKRLQWTQKVTIVLFSLGVVAAIASAAYFINRVEYQVLYRDLSPEDAQAIAGKLRDEKKDFIVSADGTSIQVAAPTSDVDKLRLEIAGSGIVRTGKVGFEIFDKSQFGMTDFTEQVNYKRALEGELGRTISSLSEIQMARVHLVLPKDSLFEDKKEDAKASVVLRLRKNSDLSKPSINGIVNLVAAAVEGLQAYNVSVVDWQGNLLSQPLASGGGARSEIESGIRSQIEKEMVTKVVSILEPLVGKGKVHANASMVLDFNSSEQTEETYNPNGPAISSQQKSEERMGGGGAASGPVGTTNPPGNSTSAAPERLRQHESTNYEISKMVRHTVQPKGSIRRLSVAVILDHKTIYSKGKDGKVTTAFQARTQKELDAYKELVLAAVGFDTKRGDQVTLENVPFFNENVPEEDRPPVPWYVKWQGYLLPAMKYASLLVLFLLVYLILFRPMKTRVYQSLAASSSSKAENQVKEIGANLDHARIRSSGSTDTLPGTRPQGNLLSGQAGVGASPQQVSLEMADNEIEREFMNEVTEAAVGARRGEALRKRLTEQVKREPEQVSNLLRTWMTEA